MRSNHWIHAVALVCAFVGNLACGKRAVYGPPKLPVYIDYPDAGTCAVGRTLCTDDCANLLTNPTHCGACGTSCNSDQVCVGGTCTAVCPPGQCEIPEW